MTSLLQLFEGHYWDSLEPKKNLVMDHVRAVLKFHDPAQTPRRTLDAMANRIELLKPIAAKSPDGAEWDRFIINVSPVERDRIVAALRTGDVAQGPGGCGDEIEDLRGDAATLRGFIREFEMTPSMMASERDHWRQRALKAEGAGEPAQAPANCDCGFSAEVCKTNPCMRKKMATSGLNPEAKYPYCGTESVAQASPSVQKAIAHFWTKATEYDHEKLRAIYNDMHELQDRAETIPLSQALDAVDLALQIIDRLFDATAGSANDPL